MTRTPEALTSSDAASEVPGPSGGTRSFLPAVEGMRACAAMGVVLTHVAFQTGTSGGVVGRLLHRFDLAVAVFFALSGFLLWRGHAAAARQFAAVVPLDAPWTFHLPFESVYDRWFLRDERVRRATRVVCTSSAGLSLEALYDQPVEVLYGARIVRRLFTHNWRSLRVRHEADLGRIIAEIRAARGRRHAA
jgi:hypothetical protein